MSRERTNLPCRIALTLALGTGCMAGGAHAAAAQTGAGVVPLPGASWARSSGGDRSVTYAGDVAEILRENCLNCHREGSIGPMSLESYESVRPYASLIRSKVGSRQMPPWPLDKGVGIQHFKNDISLTDEEIETIVRWVDQGAPLGDPAAVPEPPIWPEWEDAWEVRGCLRSPAGHGDSVPDVHRRGQRDGPVSPDGRDAG